MCCQWWKKVFNSINTAIYKYSVRAQSRRTFILPMRADSANAFQWEWSGLLPFADFCNPHSLKVQRDRALNLVSK